MGVETIVPVMGMLTFWGAVVAILLVPRYFKSRERQALQATLRAAIEKGQPLPPEVIDTINRDVRPAPSGSRDLRVGVIWIGVAAGIVGLAYALGYSDDDAAHAFYPLLGIAAFPGFIGLAFLIMALINRDQGKV
jgi:hypothetical protein